MIRFSIKHYLIPLLSVLAGACSSGSNSVVANEADVYLVIEAQTTEIADLTAIIDKGVTDRRMKLVTSVGAPGWAVMAQDINLIEASLEMFKKIGDTDRIYIFTVFVHDESFRDLAMEIEDALEQRLGDQFKVTNCREGDGNGLCPIRPPILFRPASQVPPAPLAAPD